MATNASVVVGAERMDAYLEQLEGESVGLLVNHTSLVNRTHLVDTLLSQGVQVRRIFAPEHGFRGTADAGEVVSSTVDEKTSLPIVSLYGSNRKPKPTDLEGLDIVIFDIQDVGARFYTYISSMTYMMAACAENDVAFMVLDRPNPNGHFVDGPVLKPECSSFIGLHEVPIAHGMTVGEYARMVNEWKGIHCDLTVIPCANYDHKTFYELPVKPSPNLPNMTAIYLYPSIGLFEMTKMSVGRGTDKQFQVIGHPDYLSGDFHFTPADKPGANNPKFEGQPCRGYDLSTLSLDSLRSLRRVNLSWLIEAYGQYGSELFDPRYCILYGNDDLPKQLASGMGEEEIRATWQADLAEFKLLRKKYLLYPDFE